MARYRLKIPDYNDDVGEFVEITVEAENEVQARQLANEQMPGVYWDGADCVRMRDGTEPTS